MRIFAFFLLLALIGLTYSWSFSSCSNSHGQFITNLNNRNVGYVKFDKRCISGMSIYVISMGKECCHTSDSEVKEDKEMVKKWPRHGDKYYPDNTKEYHY